MGGAQRRCLQPLLDTECVPHKVDQNTGRHLTGKPVHDEVHVCSHAKHNHWDSSPHFNKIDSPASHTKAKTQPPSFTKVISDHYLLYWHAWMKTCTSSRLTPIDALTMENHMGNLPLCWMGAQTQTLPNLVINHSQILSGRFNILRFCFYKIFWIHIIYLDHIIPFKYLITLYGLLNVTAILLVVPEACS